MPGSSWIFPNPVICPMPTQPDHTATAAGAARISSGHGRTVIRFCGTATDRSAVSSGASSCRSLAWSADGQDLSGPVSS